ncbi:MAG: septum formation initiator family protein [Minisyncoccia bacterium]
MKKRAKKENKFLNFFIFFLLISGIIFFTKRGFYIYNLIKETELKKKFLESEIQKLLAEKDQLQNQLSEKYQEKYLEEVARNNLNLKKEGERIFTFAGINNIEKELKNEELNNKKNSINTNNNNFSILKNIKNIFIRLFDTFK